MVMRYDIEALQANIFSQIDYWSRTDRLKLTIYHHSTFPRRSRPGYHDLTSSMQSVRHVEMPLGESRYSTCES